MLLTRRFIAAAILGSVVLPQIAAAHLQAPDLNFFGPFGATTVHCVRVLNTVTRRCFDRVFELKRQCIDAELAGQGCDTAGRDAGVAAAIQSAQQAVDRGCRGGQLTELRFNGFDEAKADIARVCGDQTTAALSVIYQPALTAGAGASVSSGDRACMAHVGDAGRRLIHRIIRLDSRALNRMAAKLIGPSIKRAIMNDVTAGVVNAAGLLIDRIPERCAGFSGLYHLDVATLLARLAPRASCVINASYIQMELMCPTPVCGNGVQETGEQCDDGNTIGGDTCSSTCTALRVAPLGSRVGPSERLRTLFRPLK